jgi:hypothetical protein
MKRGDVDSASMGVDSRSVIEFAEVEAATVGAPTI